MKTTTKWIGIIAIVFLLMITVTYNYMYKSHRNIASEEAIFQNNALALTNEFKQDTNKASQKYLNNVVLVDGVITDIESDGIVLNNTVYVQFSEPDSRKFSLKEHFKIKGRCLGYDELLELVKFDQSVVIN